MTRLYIDSKPRAVQVIVAIATIITAPVSVVVAVVVVVVIDGASVTRARAPGANERGNRRGQSHREVRVRCYSVCGFAQLVLAEYEGGRGGSAAGRHVLGLIEEGEGKLVRGFGDLERVWGLCQV